MNENWTSAGMYLLWFFADAIKGVADRQYPCKKDSKHMAMPIFYLVYKGNIQNGVVKQVCRFINKSCYCCKQINDDK
jgi:hypothetical protein